MIWVFVFLIAAVALGLLVEPFFRTQKPADSLEDVDYLAAQVADVERDQAAGLLSEEEAEAAAIEARRRLLAAAQSKEKARAASPFARQAGAMLVVAAPLAAVALYLSLGNPGRQATEAGGRIAANRLTQQQTAQNARPLAESIASLEARLQENPDNLDDWVMLGETYANLGRFNEAATAYGRARALAPDLAFLHAAEGESIAMAAGGIVTEEARAAFNAALAVDSQEPRARFYLALAADQQGNREEALDRLVALYQSAPANAPWRSTVRSQIEAIAREIGKPLGELGLAGEASPADALEAEIAAGNASYESWIALIDAYAAAGDLEKAKDALARAKARYTGAPFVLQELEKVEGRLGGAASSTRGPTAEQMQAASDMSADEREQMIEGMVAGLAARLEDEPDDLEGWTMLARSYAVLGQYQNSANAFAQAISLDPDDVRLALGRAEALLNQLDAEGKPIDAEAKDAVDAVAKLDPAHPFALYFLGLAASQEGDKDAARQYWTQLLQTMPASAPEAAQVQEMIDAL